MGGDLQLFQQSRGLGSVTETVSPELDAEPRVLARRSDPETSHRAAENAAMRSGSHKALLLIAYGYAENGYTDEEAASVAGLSHIGFWKRCSDLRNLGFIIPNGLERRVSSGLMAQVCEITLEGKRLRATLATHTR